MEIRLTVRQVHFESFKAIPPYASSYLQCSTFYKLLNYVDKHNSSILNLQMDTGNYNAR
ncbi:hypothetical protein D3C71_2026900 [compost metagenome]